jgi:hypothetical protein
MKIRKIEVPKLDSYSLIAATDCDVFLNGKFLLCSSAMSGITDKEVMHWKDIALDLHKSSFEEGFLLFCFAAMDSTNSSEETQLIAKLHLHSVSVQEKPAEKICNQTLALFPAASASKTIGELKISYECTPFKR